jgi:hypothetical protein
MFEQLMNAILSEYGLFVTFLITINGGFAFTIKLLWEHNKELGNRLMDTIENNTRVITKIVDKLENHDDEH